MLSFNNQRIILETLKETYEKRTDIFSPILSSPGLCNGLLHLFHRKCIKRMKETNSAFTLETAIRASQDVKIIYNKITNGEDNLDKRINQLSYFQSPREKQPHGSFCEQNDIYIDDIDKINSTYNFQKYKNQNKSFNSIEDAQSYFVFYKGFSVTQQFSGCISKEDSVKVLAYYLPRYKNQLVRIATPIHVVGIGFHTNENDQYITIFDANYDIENPLKIIKIDDLEQGISELVSNLNDSFYSSYSFDSEYDHNLALSIKFYSLPSDLENQKMQDQARIELRPEKSGSIFLLELLKDKIIYLKDCNFTDYSEALSTDPNGYNSLLVSAEYGHLETVRTLLTQFPNEMNPSQLQGKEYFSTPLNASKKQGHTEIFNLLKKHSLV